MLSDVAHNGADDIARAEALDVSRSFIVQAPAGSGKTELLIQRYLHLLAVVQQPEEILAITFTNKAAREMQNRVLEALRKARSGASAESAHENVTLLAAGRVLERDRHNDWHLIDFPGRMRIQTVDAFCAGVSRSLPLSSGLGGSAATLADESMQAVYREAAAATLDYLTVDDASGAAVERILLHLDNNVAAYISYLVRMLATREQWLPITGGGVESRSAAAALREHLQGNIAEVVEGQLTALREQVPPECHEELLRLLRYAADSLVSAGRDEHPLVSFADCDRLPAGTADAREKWQALASLLLIKDGSWRRSVTKNDGFPPSDDGQKAALFDLIDSLREHHLLQSSLDRARLLPAASYSDEQWMVLLALLNVLPLAAGELVRLFGERGVTDHNEVAIAAGRALGTTDEPGEIALVLDYTVQHLLVDEMQDTSAAQYELLTKLTSGWGPGEGKTIFCVGDPMQSIYRFRNAEVVEFLQAREHGIGDMHLEPLLLRRNFRSGENLVHWFNTVFSQVMPTSNDISVGAIAYAESTPVDKHRGCGDFAVHPLFGSDVKQEAAHVLSVIRQRLADDGNLAVLVRSRTHLLELLPLLREARIEYQSVEIDRLTDLPEIIDVLALTRALCHAGDRLAWLALLRGPWVGLTWQDIHALVRDDTNQTVLELCESPQRLAGLSADGADRLERFMATVRASTERHGTQSLRDRIELAWFALGGPAMLTDNDQLENVYRYFQVLDKLDKAGSLEDIGELERRLDGERVSTAASETCRLQIMTMHKAKGLQFDNVILPGLGRQPRSDDSQILNWIGVPGQRGMILGPVTSRADIDKDPLHQFIKATETEKNRMELDRLLYVACTRAVKSLDLIGSVAVKDEAESFDMPHGRSLLFRLWPALEHDYLNAFDDWRDKNPSQSSRPQQAVFVKPRLHRFRERWQTPDPLPLPEHITAERPDTDTKVEFYWVGSVARHAGTIVHRWLQHISDGRIDVDQDSITGLQVVTRRWAEDLGVPETEMEEVWQRTERALAGILGDAQGRWLLHGAGFSELALTGVYDGQLESVIIDRVRIDADGVHWIVDYKTSTHEGGDLPGFLRQEAERYRPQLQRYADIYRATMTKTTIANDVRTALYFPLLQAFCPVSS